MVEELPKKSMNLSKYINILDILQQYSIYSRHLCVKKWRSEWYGILDPNCWNICNIIENKAIG